MLDPIVNMRIAGPVIVSKVEVFDGLTILIKRPHLLKFPGLRVSLLERTILRPEVSVLPFWKSILGASSSASLRRTTFVGESKRINC